MCRPLLWCPAKSPWVGDPNQDMTLKAKPRDIIHFQPIDATRQASQQTNAQAG